MQGMTLGEIQKAERETAAAGAEGLTARTVLVRSVHGPVGSGPSRLSVVTPFFCGSIWIIQ